jgi:hypothetical protein
MKRTRITRALAVSMLALLGSSGRASVGGGAVDQAWRIRADIAARKLADPGLHGCDRALEQAFRQPRAEGNYEHRTYVLSIENGNDRMLLAYFYERGTFKSFSIAALPPGWIVLQKARSRTVTVRPAGFKCVFDLCTTDPLVDGACREDQALNP